MKSKTAAFLGLGGNLDNTAQIMHDALSHLEQNVDCQVLAVSSLYRTPPWGHVTDQPDFLNICCKITTTLEPDSLLALCLAIEKNHKRERLVRWGPRTLDIDILYMEAYPRYQSETVTLPHPRLFERGFVLYPLCEIAGKLKIENRSILDWTRMLNDDAEIVKIEQGEDWWKKQH